MVYLSPDKLAMMRKLLDSGYKLKTGYSTTNIRGYHIHYIFWR